ncbi:MAG: hypothetical protein JWR01_2428 [Subtercola sp.]|nr:hypothetical protein [Subtercola sp.]
MPDFHDALVAPGEAGLPERFFDRFMFNLHPRDALAPSVIVGAGLYPGRNVIDGFAIVTLPGEQRNLRFSTELDQTSGEEVGPFSWSLVEPLQRWHLRLGPNDTGFEFDASWQARALPWSGDVTVRGDDGSVTSSFEHLFQSGHYTGTAMLDGVALDIDGWYGQRDRSRGVRTMSGGQGLHLWFQAQFDDRSIGFLLVEDRAQRRLLLEGAVMPVGAALDAIVDVRHDLRFTDDLDLERGNVEVRTASGETYRIGVDASAKGGHMSGGGYGGHHGHPQGRNHTEFDVYPLDGTVTPRSVDTALTDRMTVFEWSGRTGVGILEFAHSRSASYTYQPSLDH